MAYEINTLIHEYIYNDILTVANAELPWDKMNNKTILITGAGGFVGKNLTATLLQKGYTNLYLYDRESTQEELEKLMAEQEKEILKEIEQSKKQK